MTLLNRGSELLILDQLLLLLDLQSELFLLQPGYLPTARVLLVMLKSAVIDGLSPESHGKVGSRRLGRERLHDSLVLIHAHLV